MGIEEAGESIANSVEESTDKITSSLDDKLDDLFENFEDYEIPTTADEEIEDETGTEFVATYQLMADTCDEFPVNAKLFEAEGEFVFYKINGDELMSGETDAKDDSIYFVLEADLERFDLHCICTIDSDYSFNCGCENDSTQCAMIYGLK